MLQQRERLPAGLAMTAVWRLALLAMLWSTAQTAWQENLRPRRYVRLDDSTTHTFSSNFSGSDFFRLLYRDDRYVVIGARDAAYNISLADLTEVGKLSWASNASTAELCRLKGKAPVQC